MCDGVSVSPVRPLISLEMWRLLASKTRVSGGLKKVRSAFT